MVCFIAGFIVGGFFVWIISMLKAGRDWVNNVPVFTVACGLCGAEIKIHQKVDGRYLSWPCRCLSERDLAVAEGLAAILDNLMRVSKPLTEKEKQP